MNQINNLLLLSQISSRSRAARKYSANEVLAPDNVGAYLFKTGDDGSSVETLEVTADSGIPTFPFTETHSALYNEAIRLEHASDNLGHSIQRLPMRLYVLFRRWMPRRFHWGSVTGPNSQPQLRQTNLEVSRTHLRLRCILETATPPSGH